MIAELILVALVGGIVGFLIVFFKKKYNDSKMLKDIPEKLEKQNVRFFADGKQLSIYEKEVKEEINTKNKTPIKQSKPKAVNTKTKTPIKQSKPKAVNTKTNKTTKKSSPKTTKKIKK